MTEGSGFTLADSTGNGNTITFNNVAWSTDIPSQLIVPLTLTLTDSVSSSDSTVKEDDKTLIDLITPSDVLALARAQNVSDSMTVTDSFSIQSSEITSVPIPTVETLTNLIIPAEVKTFYKFE